MNNKKSHLNVGKRGEIATERYYKDIGHSIISRNERYKLGELDLITKAENGIIHFIEVKTRSVIRETENNRPEENLTRHKMLRLIRAVEIFSMKNSIDLSKIQWQFDLSAVVIHETSKKIKLTIYKDIPLC